jgi:hypothetical protein
VHEVTPTDTCLTPVTSTKEGTPDACRRPGRDGRGPHNTAAASAGHTPSNLALVHTSASYP